MELCNESSHSLQIVSVCTTLIEMLELTTYRFHVAMSCAGTPPGQFIRGQYAVTLK